MRILAGCDGRRVSKIRSLAKIIVSVEGLFLVRLGPKPGEFLTMDKSADAPPISKGAVEAAHEPLDKNLDDCPTASYTEEVG